MRGDGAPAILAHPQGVALCSWSLRPLKDRFDRRLCLCATTQKRQRTSGFDRLAPIPGRFPLCTFASEQGAFAPPALPSLITSTPRSAIRHPLYAIAAADSTPHETVGARLPAEHHHGLSLLRDRSVAMRAAITAPVDAVRAHQVRCVPPSASLVVVARRQPQRHFEARSVFTHVAARMTCWPPASPLQAVLQSILYLLNRCLCFWLECDCPSHDGSWKRQLPVHGARRWRRACCGDLQSGGDGQARRVGPRGLPG